MVFWILAAFLVLVLFGPVGLGAVLMVASFLGFVAWVFKR